MATMMSIQKLTTLLTGLPDRGRMNVFMENGSGLRVGYSFDDPKFHIDFASERVISLAGKSNSLVTTPSGASVVATQAPSGRRTGIYAIEFEGHRHTADSGKELLLVGLRALEQSHPGTFEKLAKVKNRSRRIIARDPSTLFDKKHLVANNSQQIDGEWWIGTNNSHLQIHNWLEKAAQCAGVQVRIAGL